MSDQQDESRRPGFEMPLAVFVVGAVAVVVGLRLGMVWLMVLGGLAMLGAVVGSAAGRRPGDKPRATFRPGGGDKRPWDR